MSQREPQAGGTVAGILHVDLDAFYASVEQHADPNLRGRPVIVGGLGPRGVVAAASYEARRYGVRSAMPMARARRACPEGAFLAPRFDEYGVVSRRVMLILHSYTPLVEPIALDEAFLDVRGSRRVHGDPPDVAVAIRRRVHEETGLVASVGVASTKLVAKIASEAAKPDGLLVVPPGSELDFLHPLPVERLWGVGPATRRRLERLGVRTIGELAAVPEATLVATLGQKHGLHLHALARNDDARGVEPERPTKSIGHEETFAADVRDRETLEREVVRLADRVAARLRRAQLVARTVQLKVRYHDFRTITRSRTLPEHTDLARDLARTAGDLLRAVDVAAGIRLIGVTAQQLEPARMVQGALPVGETATHDARSSGGQHAAVERSVDRVRARYGDQAVVPARLLPAPERDG